MRKFLSKVLSFFFPEGITCNGCGCELTDEDDRASGFCIDCADGLEKLTKEKNTYGDLTVYSCFAYQGLVRDIVIGYKDDDQTFFARSIAVYMARLFRENALSCDEVCYIPCGNKNFRRRGYDPMEKVAKAFCEETNLPLSYALHRAKDSMDQATVDFSERYRNMEGCFCADDVSDKNVLLLDDIVTSGATLSTAADSLRESGAKEVICITLSRA